MNRVLHVWVDPHNGNDAAPLDWNPGPLVLPGNRCVSTDTHPHNVTDGSATLLHASAPFRTVTAAVNYITSIQGGLPHFNAVTGVTTSHVIIHCLPGVYGPGTGTEPHTGLTFNGETFPIHLPGRVSVQGASALNTTFIADGSKPIFEFGSTNIWLADPAVEEPRQFLANLGLTGAIREGDFGGAPEQGAAIHVAPQTHVNLLVANCNIYCNAVGILLDSPPNAPGQGIPAYPVDHLVHLVNNSFVWNVCGIWNGQIDRNADPSLPNPSKGFATICAINNLFDSFPPRDDLHNLEIPLPLPGGSRVINPSSSWGRWAAAISSTGTPSGTPLLRNFRMTNFEGVTADDLEVVFSPSVRVDFNAFESVVYNLSRITPLTIPAIDQMTYLGLHQTSPLAANPMLPSRDMQQMTGNNTGPRGIVYVRDLIHEGARASGAGFPFFISAAQGGGNWDVCLGDFRLAPAVGLVPYPRGSAPWELNPLVDRGFTGHSVVMANGRTCTTEVFGDLGNGSFPHHVDDWDGEGFGNPRTYDYPIYPNDVYYANNECHTDIGADELDQLVIVGYRAGTTNFTDDPLAGTLGSSQTNDFAWMLCPSEGHLGAVGSGVVPVLTNPVITPSHTDYLPVSGWSVAGSSSYYLPSYVDVIPHLLPDVHPWWSNAPHPIASNVFWQPCLAPGLRNITLYQDPTVGIIHPTGTHQDLGLGLGNVFDWIDIELIIAAATVYPGVSPHLVQWMDETAVSAPNTWNLTNSAAATGGWAYLDDPGVAISFLRPTQNPRFTGGDNALRHSVEWWASQNPFPNDLGGGDFESRNVQTFLTLRGGQ